MFKLHAQLQNDCIQVMDLPLSRLLLLNDVNFPWFVLVPRREKITEIYQLEKADQHQLLEESNALSQFMVEQFKPDKLNIAALGNVVPQLHIHHIARYKDDLVWPAPVWGKLAAIPYTEEQSNELIELSRNWLKKLLP